MNTSEKPIPSLSIFIPSFGDGGVERMMVNLSRGLSLIDVPVDFIISKFEGPFLSSLPPQVRVVECKTAHPTKIIPELSRYLAMETPQVLMSVKRCGQEALEARKIARVKTRSVVRIGTTVSKRVEGRNPIKRFKSFHELRKYCPRADGVIAVSHGVARDVHQITGIPLADIKVLTNPVITPEIYQLAREPVAYPWQGQPGGPIILGAGGLRRQKDFSTLLGAFAHVRRQRPAKLLILGEGRQRSRLLEQADRLDIEKDVYLPGFVDNAYAYMQKADVFVLSSRWEGSPNALTEALALGTAVVSTDCESGPCEILQNGKFGALVPVGDAAAMAQAILDTLANPTDAKMLQSAVSDYTIETSAIRYQQALNLSPAE